MTYQDETERRVLVAADDERMTELQTDMAADGWDILYRIGQSARFSKGTWVKDVRIDASGNRTEGEMLSTVDTGGY